MLKSIENSMTSPANRMYENAVKKGIPTKKTMIIKNPKIKPEGFPVSSKNPEKSTVVKNPTNVIIAEIPAIPFTIDCAHILIGSMSPGCRYF